MAGGIRCLPRDLRGRPIDRGDLTLEAVLRQLEPIRTKTVRLEDFRAGLHIFAVNVPNQIW